MRKFPWVVVAALVSSVAGIGTARGGPIADENAREGSEGWLFRNPGNAQADGVIDLYPASWSIARGETVRLKVRSTTAYAVRVYRLGWYGGVGARQVAAFDDQAADPQPYPTTADPETGLVRAGWHDSLAIPTDGSWVPGLYVARVDQPSGKQAMTFFTVRDDGASPRMPILLVVSTATHQAYNGWPSLERGGKSLYGFNSSPERPSASSSNQAVKVSLDRPFLVGAGSADVLRYEYPFVRWAEQSGYDVAMCNDEDLDRDPSLVDGRRAIVWSGHWEYVSRPMFEAALHARDAGEHLLFMSGDTIAWHVRYEDGGRTMVGYKEGWVGDPEERAGQEAQANGDLEGARRHYALVTRGWKNVGSELGSDERTPGISLTGVQSAGAMGPNGPWGDLRLEDTSPWFFEGTGFAPGDRITRVMGYEYDSLHEDEPEWDPFRPKGQVKLGTILHRRTGAAVGGASYYRHASGADVVALGAVNFAWALDDFADDWGGETSADRRVQKMIDNLLRAWTRGAPPPSLPDAGPSESGGDPDAGDDGTSGDPATTDGGGGCGWGGRGAHLALLATIVALLAAFARRRLARS